MAWFAAVFAATLAVQVAANSGRFTALGGWLDSFARCCVIALVGSGLGRAIVGGHGDASERTALSIGIGLGVLSLATLTLGMIGLLRAETGWALLAVALLGGLRSLRAWLAEVGAALRELWPDDRLSRFAALYCGFALSVALLNSLAPATAWDALVYHLKGPELFAAAGRLGQPIDLPYLGFPQFQEMLFLLARLIGAQDVAVLHWLFAAASVLLIYSLARRAWGHAGGWIAAAVFLSAPTVVSLAGWPYADLTLAFHVVAAFACLQRARENPDDAAWLWLAGAFTGFAAGTKYTSLFALAGLLIACLLAGERKRLPHRVLNFSAVAFALTAPWLVKNVIATGNPVYPFFFDGPFWDSLRAAWLSRAGSGLLFTAPLRLPLAPLEATVFGLERRTPYEAAIGPLFLMFAPMVAPGLRSPANRILRDAAIVCGMAFAGWLAMIAVSALLMQTRLLFPIFPLLAVLAAGGFEALRQSTRFSTAVKRLASALVVAWLAFVAIGLASDFGASGVTAVLSGARSREDYLVDRLGWHAVAVQAINRLPPGSRVVFLWEPRTLYCQIECWPDAILDRWWHARQVHGPAEAIAQAWREAGFTHVLLFRTGYRFIVDDSFDPISPADQDALIELIDSHLRLVETFGGEYELYAWR
jgi:hypothetical protein